MYLGLARCEPALADHPGDCQRKVPAPVRLANILERHPQTNGSVFMFPSPPEIASRMCCVSARRSPSEPVLGMDSNHEVDRSLKSCNLLILQCR
jgi:hypothetical protein